MSSSRNIFCSSATHHKVHLSLSLSFPLSPFSSLSLSLPIILSTSSSLSPSPAPSFSLSLFLYLSDSAATHLPLSLSTTRHTFSKPEFVDLAERRQLQRIQMECTLVTPECTVEAFDALHHRFSEHLGPARATKLKVERALG